MCASETGTASGSKRANKIGEVTVSTPLFDQAPNFDSLKVRFLTTDDSSLSKREKEVTLVHLDTPNTSKLVTGNTQNFSFVSITEKPESETTVLSEESCNQSSNLKEDLLVPLISSSAENNRVKVSGVQPNLFV